MSAAAAINASRSNGGGTSAPLWGDSMMSGLEVFFWGFVALVAIIVIVALLLNWREQREQKRIAARLAVEALEALWKK